MQEIYRLQISGNQQIINVFQVDIHVHVFTKLMKSLPVSVSIWQLKELTNPCGNPELTIRVGLMGMTNVTSKHQLLTLGL